MSNKPFPSLEITGRKFNNLKFSIISLSSKVHCSIMTSFSWSASFSHKKGVYSQRWIFFFVFFFCWDQCRYDQELIRLLVIIQAPDLLFRFCSSVIFQYWKVHLQKTSKLFLDLCASHQITPWNQIILGG